MKKLTALLLLCAQTALADNLLSAIYASDLKEVKILIDQSQLNKTDFARYVEIADQKISLLKEQNSSEISLGSIRITNQSFNLIKNGMILYGLSNLCWPYIDIPVSIYQTSLSFSRACVLLGLYNLKFEELKPDYLNALAIKDLLYKKYPDFIE